MPRTTKTEAEKSSDELTLRLDGALITPQDFKLAVQAFTDLLIQVTEVLSAGEAKPVWNMSVRTGSTVIVARAFPNPKTKRRAQATIRAIRSGIIRIQKGAIDVPHFNKKALFATRDLASLRSEDAGPGIPTIQIAAGKGKSAEITRAIADHLKRNLGVQRKAYGSIEGKLQTITDRGTYQFVVYDDLSDRGVNCFVAPGLFKQAHAAFGKRVAVSGEISYDRTGKPLAIKARAIRIFREISELPPIERFRGIFKPA